VPAARIDHDIYRDSRIFDFGLFVLFLPGHAGPMRIYYGLRNSIALNRRVRPMSRVLLQYGIGYVLAQLNDLIFGPDRWTRLQARTLGLRDGLRGRMGRADYPVLTRRSKR
jgi:hypothetical protein